MKTKKLNLAQRLEVAKRKLNFWQTLEAYEMARGKSCVFERDVVKQYATYIKNTCDMHDLTFSTILFSL